jgi:hypothetical protein
MKSTFTRREAGLLLATASAVLAQRPQTEAGATALEDPTAAVEQRHRDRAAELARVKLPLDTEPAFEFQP